MQQRCASALAQQSTLESLREAQGVAQRLAADGEAESESCCAASLAMLMATYSFAPASLALLGHEPPRRPAGYIKFFPESREREGAGEGQQARQESRQAAQFGAVAIWKGMCRGWEGVGAVR